MCRCEVLKSRCEVRTGELGGGCIRSCSKAAQKSLLVPRLDFGPDSTNSGLRLNLANAWLHSTDIGRVWANLPLPRIK